MYSDIRSAGAALLWEACEALEAKGSSTAVFNSLPWERHEVVQITDGTDAPVLGMLDFLNIHVLTLKSTNMYQLLCGPSALLRAPSVGVSPVKDAQPVTPVSVTPQVFVSYRGMFDSFTFSFQQRFVIFQTDGSVIMENGILRTVISKDGTLASLCLIAANR